MAERQADGRTLRQHLEIAAAHSEEARAELAGPGPCPPAAEHIWTWFRALDEGRGGSGFGANPLSWAELDAFCRQTGVQMSAFESGCLRALDRLALASLNKPAGPA